MFNNPPKKKKLSIVVSCLVSGISMVAQAGTLTGSQESAIVAAGDTPENWTVSNGARLNIATGGMTGTVSVSNNSFLSSDGGFITVNTGSQLLAVDNSQAILFNTSVRNEQDSYRNVALNATNASTSVMLSNNSSVFSHGGRGINIVREATVTLNDSSVRSDISSSSSLALADGVAVNILTGAFNATNSTVSGGQSAIWVTGSNGGAIVSSADIDITGSLLHSDQGAAIQIARPSALFTNPTVNILLRDGSTVEAGNGNLLEASDSDVSLRILNAYITGNIDVAQSAAVNTTLDKGGVFNGSTSNSGTLNMAVLEGGTWQITGDSSLTSLSNAGSVSFSSGSAGRTLMVNGDYQGNDGILIFNSVLGDDLSQTDRLVIGGNTSGNTLVRVNNLGGSGAPTLNGIEIIEVGGVSDGEFQQSGRIVAGAYDYRLIRGNGSNSSNWYLSSDLTDSGGGDNGGGDNGGGDNGDDGNSGEMVLRPEAGAYAANLANASTLFDTRMSDRQGTYYLDPLTGEKKHTSLWLRTSGAHNRLNAGNAQLNTRANSFVTLLGGDIAASDKARVGLMAGYGNSKSNTVSDITGYRAKGSLNGYTTGLYGTWFAEGTDEKGLWADSTLQYSWFDNSVDGEGASGETYKSQGITASLSTGYVIPLGEGERKAFFLQPQARVGWSGIKADDHTERNGTKVQSSGQDNVSSSLGVKAFMKGHASLDDSTGRQFNLYTEANWIHNSREYAVRMDEVTVSQSGSRNIAEARVGIDGNLGNGFGVKGSIGQQVGDKGWSETSASVSLNYRF